MTGIANGLYSTWRDVDIQTWRWPHFRPAELACRCPTDLKFCDGEYYHDDDFLDHLEEMRAIVDRPIHSNSARRCALRNAYVKGAAFSQHKISVAMDISLAGHDPVTLARAAAKAGFKGIGFGSSFLHVDARVRPPSWPRNKPWVVPVAFHYPGAKEAWIKRFGFDPVTRFNTKGHLDG